MLILGLVLSGTGLVLVAISGYILLKNLFVSDEELNMLSKLPIEPSNSGMTGMTSGKNLPAAVTDPDKLKEYRTLYIKERETERKNGRKGLWLLIFGTALQVIGLICSAIVG